MKSKYNILSQQYSTLTYIPETRSSLKLRKARNTLDGQDEDISWNNMSEQKPNQKESMSKSKGEYLPSTQDCKKILLENEDLKKEIKRLTSMLGFKKNLRSIQKLKSEGHQDVDQQKVHLKKIIQKSYYSIKEMEKQIQKLTEDLHNANSNLHKFEHRYRLLELENENIQNKLNNTVSVHKQEMILCNERIRQLQMRIEQLMNLMEEDQNDWRRHKDELNKLKKFYFKRTSL